TPVEIRNVLAGKKIFKKGLKSKAGKTYDAYLIPDGVEKYTYEKDGVTKNGVGMKYRMEFPKDTGKKKK
ncbi:MAG: DNA topoisomerase III, partial [Lachnospiraceae bacterium]|nr:DNA topoisomerase III [Lachnospiraceae bacterium]